MRYLQVVSAIWVVNSTVKTYLYFCKGDIVFINFIMLSTGGYPRDTVNMGRLSGDISSMLSGGFITYLVMNKFIGLLFSLFGTLVWVFQDMVIWLFLVALGLCCGWTSKVWKHSKPFSNVKITHSCYRYFTYISLEKLARNWEKMKVSGTKTSLFMVFLNLPVTSSS